MLHLRRHSRPSASAASLLLLVTLPLDAFNSARAAMLQGQTAADMPTAGPAQPSPFREVGQRTGDADSPFKPALESQTAPVPLEPDSRPGGATPDNGGKQQGEITGPRQLFAALGAGDSHFRSFVDGQDIGPADREALLKVLVRLPDFPQEKIERWANKELPRGELLAAPDPHRGEIFRLTGRLLRISIERPLPEAATRFGFSRYYRCELTLDEGSVPVVVYTRAVPKEWQGGVKSPQRASALGFFLKVGETLSGQPQLILAARRVAWHPSTMLGDLGMDYGLFDMVRNGAPIRATETECFYQMLSAVGRADPEELRRRARDLSIVPLLQNPRAQHGRLLSLSGTARRAVPIRIKEPETIARLGFDQYYEVDVFVELGGVIKVDDKEIRTYPVTFCVIELPAGMPVGENINEPVRIAGFFFKTWSYQSELVSANAARLQISPLLIGRTIQWLAPPRTDRNPYLGLIAGGIFAVALIIICFVLWRLSRSDRRFRTARRARNVNLPASKTMNDVGPELPPEPDRANV